MHEADTEPPGDQVRLRVDDLLEERERVVAGSDRIGVVPREGMGRQRSQGWSRHLITRPAGTWPELRS